ncbi:unnamed protein product [Schistosoma mattheei]|uniref:Uncharacterized protein n=2 Tax=Schistosoma TaxID=6181 RepID=A0A3P8KPQ3_9TREM|nr:unnamed protein product [Schistosoma mattheei]
MLLNINTTNMSTAKKLDLMLFFVKRVVILASIIGDIPVKYKFPLIKSPRSTLSQTLLTQVALFDSLFFLRNVYLITWTFFLSCSFASISKVSVLPHSFLKIFCASLSFQIFSPFKIFRLFFEGLHLFFTLSLNFSLSSLDGLLNTLLLRYKFRFD